MEIEDFFGLLPFLFVLVAVLSVRRKKPQGGGSARNIPSENPFERQHPLSERRGVPKPVFEEPDMESDEDACDPEDAATKPVPPIVAGTPGQRPTSLIELLRQAAEESARQAAARKEAERRRAMQERMEAEQRAREAESRRYVNPEMTARPAHIPSTPDSTDSCDTCKPELTAEDFDIRKAVVYSAVLSPKFDE